MHKTKSEVVPAEPAIGSRLVRVAVYDLYHLKIVAMTEKNETVAALHCDRFFRGILNVICAESQEVSRFRSERHLSALMDFQRLNQPKIAATNQYPPFEARPIPTRVAPENMLAR